jgi:hypothetical protein
MPEVKNTHRGSITNEPYLFVKGETMRKYFAIGVALMLVAAGSVCVGKPPRRNAWHAGAAPESGGNPKESPRPNEIAIPEGVDPDLAKDAGNKAIKALLTDFFQRSDIQVKRFAILPMQQDVDGGYFTDQFRNLFSAEGGNRGFELYTRMDNEWNMLLKEIAWGQSYADTMDPSTVQKFGRIQGVEGLIIPRANGVTKYRDDDVKMRFSMQAFEVETGKLMWGEEKVAYGKRSGTESGGIIGFLTDWDSKKIKSAVFIALGVIVVLVLLRILSAMRVAARPR